MESILHFNPDLSADDLATREAAVKVAEKTAYSLLKTATALAKFKSKSLKKRFESKLMQSHFYYRLPRGSLAFGADVMMSIHMLPTVLNSFVGGREIANGFTELNDAEDQAARFQKQVEDKDAGDIRSHAL